MKITRLIELLQKLPSTTRVWTCGLEGVNPCEEGNLFPMKVLETEFGIGLYIDDGLMWHDQITREWVPLDEFVTEEDSDGNQPA